MATRKQVAELAGVSEAVVSYVLHNKPVVKETTRRKVLEAIQQLGYRPNMMARGLKMKQSRQIAVLVGSLGNPFEAGVLLHVEQTAQRHGYAVFFHSYSEQGEEELKEQLHGRVDGVMLLGQSLREDTIDHFLSTGTPLFSLMAPAIAHEGVKSLDLDWTKAMAKLAAHLKERGHQRVALMTHGSPRHYTSSRAIAFREAAEAEGLMCSDEMTLFGGGTFEKASAVMAEKLESCAQGATLPYTAIVAVNDLMALGVLSACRKMDVNVPVQLAVAGCEGILMSGETSPPLTTLVYPREELGSLGTAYFIGAITAAMTGEANERPAAGVLEAELTVRGSV
ncbi:LacI family DNA-binding transcriptional regulator [Paenibacillus sp. CAU 1782]